MTEQLKDLIGQTYSLPIGVFEEAEDGAIVLVGFDGSILDALSPQGEQLNPDDYEAAKPADMSEPAARVDWMREHIRNATEPADVTAP